MNFLTRISIGFMALGVFTPNAANAAEQLVIKTDQAQMLTLSTLPGAAIVGNPSIADVTVNGQQIFVHGRAFGETNLIILDVEGNQLANFDIAVQKNANNDVVVFKAGTKLSFVCATNCETAAQVGDDLVYFEGVVSQSKSKSGLAKESSTSGTATAPAAE